MSILIKGMEMPKSCSVCFAREISGAGAGVSYCRLGGALDFDYTERRMVFCPLIPVPPHGDLIDRDAYQYSGDLMDEPVIIPAEEGYECPY